VDIPTDRASVALLALLAQTVTRKQHRALPTVVTPDLAVQHPLFFSIDGASFAQFIQLGQIVRINKFISQE
jgi:hypothetical protein